MNISCVITAAGAGSRFGGNKLLHPIAGRPMLEHVLLAMPPEAFSRRVVVLPPGAGALQAICDTLGFETVVNPKPEAGLSGSVKLGLGAIRSEAEPDGVLFAVGDQPYLTRESVARLLAVFSANPQRIVALAVEGKRGNPVVFPRQTFADFDALAGDRGGSQVIARHPELLLLCEARAAKELADVDYK